MSCKRRLYPPLQSVRHNASNIYAQNRPMSIHVYTTGYKIHTPALINMCSQTYHIYLLTRFFSMYHAITIRKTSNWPPKPTKAYFGLYPVSHISFQYHRAVLPPRLTLLQTFESNASMWWKVYKFLAIRPWYHNWPTIGDHLFVKYIWLGCQCHQLSLLYTSKVLDRAL